MHSNGQLVKLNATNPSLQSAIQSKQKTIQVVNPSTIQDIKRPIQITNPLVQKPYTILPIPPIVTKSSETKEQKDNPVINPTVKQTEKVPQYGITAAVNTSPPTQFALKKSKEFTEWFSKQGILESAQMMSKKLSTLEKLNKLTKKWIVSVLTKRRMPEAEAKIVGGHIRTFGSYRLGIHTAGGDIDAVMVVPMHITRKDFNESFSVYLRSVSEVKNLRVIPDAYVPLMKFTFGEIDFDLLFCRIKIYKLDDDLRMNNTKILKDMDLKDIRSINGFRIAEDILNLVPSQKNFKVVLHAIRLWAKRNELYSNIVGFFGGITWAILVARICQLYPRAAPSVLIQKFFMAFSQWDWDKHTIVLKKIEYAPHGLTLPQWHRSAPDRNKLISIITPTYPEQNTVHNVSLSTRAIIAEKLSDASLKIDAVMRNEAPWDVLFEPDNFFGSYNHFLILSTTSDDDVKWIEFNGYIESRLRHLVTMLEKNIFIKIVHPYPKSFDALPSENLNYCKRFFFGLAITKPDENAQVKIDLMSDLKIFEQEIMGKSHFLMTNPDKKISFVHCKRKELKQFIPVELIGKAVKKFGKESAKGEDEITPPDVLQHLMPIGGIKRKADDNECKESQLPKSNESNGSNGESDKGIIDNLMDNALEFDDDLMLEESEEGQAYLMKEEDMVDAKKARSY